MGKAILVIDMPSSCNECKINGIFCGDVGDNDMCRAGGCPLKEVPQKQTIHCTDTSHHRFAKNGYNTCIDEILKGSGIDG